MVAGAIYLEVVRAVVSGMVVHMVVPAKGGNHLRYGTDHICLRDGLPHGKTRQHVAAPIGADALVREHHHGLRGPGELTAEPFQLLVVHPVPAAAMCEVVAVGEVLKTIAEVEVIAVQDNEAESAVGEGIIVALHAVELAEFVLGVVVHVVVAQHRVFRAGMVQPKAGEISCVFAGKAEVPQLDEEVEFPAGRLPQKGFQALFRLGHQAVVDITDHAEAHRRGSLGHRAARKNRRASRYPFAPGWVFMHAGSSPCIRRQSGLYPTAIWVTGSLARTSNRWPPPVMRPLAIGA